MSFSRAAERLHLSQSAVSQNIRALEREFNVELFERRGRSLRLTVGGQALLPMAQETVGAPAALLLQVALLRPEAQQDMPSLRRLLRGGCVGHGA